MTDSAEAAASDREPVALREPLTPEEDDELRRLHYLAQNGQLSPRSSTRIRELRGRDRRQTVRSPREFGEPDARPVVNRRGSRLKALFRVR